MSTSLCLMVRNEEEALAGSLQSIAPIAGEIIVVDTGSTDRTKEIATSFGAKVFDFPWIDDFAAARNECIRHATGEWIFWMDADERVDEVNREKLRALFQSLHSLEGERGRQGDTETGRQGDKETQPQANHSPLTTHHSPLTTHQTTTHPSLLITHHCRISLS